MKRIVKLFRKYKLYLATYTVVAILSTTLNAATIVMCCNAAYLERGYKAIGGEWILAITLCFVEWRFVLYAAKSWWKSKANKR